MHCRLTNSFVNFTCRVQIGVLALSQMMAKTDESKALPQIDGVVVA